MGKKISGRRRSFQDCTERPAAAVVGSNQLIHLWVISEKNIFATNIDVAFSYIDNMFYQFCKEE